MVANLRGADRYLAKMEPNHAKTPQDSRKQSRAAALERIRTAQTDGPAVLAHRLASGDRVALGQAITLVESRRVEDRPSAEELLQAVLQMTASKPPALRIGITGIPGVGKSTLIESLGTALIGQGHWVAVLAVDPTSERSGGSVLGDKTRMSQLAQNPNAFVRPSPAVDTLGGVARATHEVSLLCEAAGFDRILIETVGVGQSETSVRNMSDVFLLLLMGGTGDELQGIKRGIMEMADLIWINKADGKGTQTAQEAASAVRYALHLLPPAAHGETVEVLVGSGLTGMGLETLQTQIEALRLAFAQSGFDTVQRQQQQERRMDEMMRQSVVESIFQKAAAKAKWSQLQNQVQQGQISAYSAVRAFIQSIASGA